ncbi:putative reverse transcriptase zinc-binding domain-containing protein [Helianthus annuus]|nr:putative reverse transcriptase zinc-binding domain-containing protein [Helianthus annuus]
MVDFLIWRIVQDKLPTTTALARRNIFVLNTRCKMCEDEDESALHLFVSCRIAVLVWEFISQWCKLSPIYVLELKDSTNINNRNKGSRKWRKSPSMVTLKVILVIWRSRNESVFNGKQIIVTRIK